MTEPSAAAAPVDRLCPKCDVSPDTSEPVCPTCGSRLVDLIPPARLIGAVIDGRFEVRGILGEGGMGTVYRAWQRSIGREVAIKVIEQRQVRDAMAVRRFLREAKLASQLSQPNTVSVIDFGQSEEGSLYIAMELVKGRTLGQVVADEGRFELARAVRVGVQLCDALEAAHALAIVHRDLKPANVMLLDGLPGRDLVKVLDFGLAKSLAGDDTESTMTGMIVGTPRYMAPEIGNGGDATPASDLYALGVMLAELTSGRRMFEGQNLPVLLWQKVREVHVPDEVPVVLRPLIEQLVDPDPARRPTSAAAVRAGLMTALAREGSGEVTASVVGPPATLGGAREAPTVPTEALEPARTPTPTPTVPTVRPRARRRFVIGVLVAASVAAGGLVALALQVRGHGRAAAAADAAPVAAVAVDAGAAPVAAVAVDAGAAVDAAATVTLTFRATPPATVVVAGEAKGTTPLDVAWPRGEAPVAIRLTRRGYRPHDEDVVPDRARTVDARLEPAGRQDHATRPATTTTTTTTGAPPHHDDHPPADDRPAPPF